MGKAYGSPPGRMDSGDLSESVISLMETLDGEVLACADSSWAYIDVKTGHPVKASEEERAAYPVEEKLDMKLLGRRIRIPEAAGDGRLYRPPVSSGLQSSCKQCTVYPIVAGIHPADFQVQRLRAEYKRQAVLEIRFSQWFRKQRTAMWLLYVMKRKNHMRWWNFPEHKK